MRKIWRKARVVCIHEPFPSRLNANVLVTMATLRLRNDEVVNYYMASNFDPGVVRFAKAARLRPNRHGRYNLLRAEGKDVKVLLELNSRDGGQTFYHRIRELKEDK